MFKQGCRKEPSDVISSEFIEGEFSPRYLARFILFWLALQFVQFCNARQPAVSAKSDLKAFEQMVPLAKVKCLFRARWDVSIKGDSS